jgi:hypothetical protein
MSSTRKRVENLLSRHGSAQAVLSQSAADVAEPERPRFRAAYARAARLLGSDAARRILADELSDLGRPHWTLLDWTRAALLLSALERLPTERGPALVLALFEGGEIGEQESLLRTLSLLSEPELHVETGVMACRTNAVRVFEAMACENPYPSAFFPVLAFNQMVLKAVFLDVSVQRIEALHRRVTAELGRMALAYASERRVAGRDVPADVDFIVRSASSRDQEGTS